MTDVFTHKIDAMKEIQRFVAIGYQRYVFGNVTTAPELQKIVMKFEDRYRINATRQMRYRAKERGEANAQLVIYMDEVEQKFYWWLLVTNGFGLVDEMEKLLDATNKKQRLTHTGYELVRLPDKESKVRWTWCCSKDNYAAWEERIRVAVRSKNQDLIKQAIYSLERMPCFKGTRQEAYTLWRYLSNEYKRAFKNKIDYIFNKNFYGRYKVARTIPLEHLSTRKRKALKAWEDACKDAERGVLADAMLWSYDPKTKRFYDSRSGREWDAD